MNHVPGKAIVAIVFNTICVPENFPLASFLHLQKEPTTAHIPISLNFSTKEKFSILLNQLTSKISDFILIFGANVKKNNF